MPSPTINRVLLAAGDAGKPVHHVDAPMVLGLQGIAPESALAALLAVWLREGVACAQRQQGSYQSSIRIHAHHSKATGTITSSSTARSQTLVT